MKKRLLSLLLCFCLMAGGIPVFAPAARASTNGHTQAEAVQWVKARADERWEINDGSGWTQCTEFLWAYYEYLLGYHVGGHAYHYLGDSYNARPGGWTRPDKNTVQPGDIVIWDRYASFNARRSDYYRTFYAYEKGKTTELKVFHIHNYPPAYGETVECKIGKVDVTETEFNREIAPYEAYAYSSAGYNTGFSINESNIQRMLQHPESVM